MTKLHPSQNRNTSPLWIVTKQSLEGLKIREKSEVFFPTNRTQHIKFERKATVEKNILKLQEVRAKGDAVGLGHWGGQGRMLLVVFL